MGADGSKAINVTSSWQKITHTVKSFQYNTNPNSRYEMYTVFFYGLNANQFSNGQGIEIAQVKLELGEYATPFVPKSYKE